MDFDFKRDKDNQLYIETSLKGYSLITNPLVNKGMGFTEQERVLFNLFGLLPPHYSSLEEQRKRSYQACLSKSSPLEQYLYLRDLQDSNETLFYSLLLHHLDKFLPIVYTPTVGEGCLTFSHIYRRSRGLFISYPDKLRIDSILENPYFDKVEVIVVSDGERILGLGDQGAGGMGIPIGKLALYSACAGIHPAKTLPILLDTGTNNCQLRADPLYIGWNHERIREKEYDDFIEHFVAAVHKRFPHVLLQWEDFAQQNAGRLLKKYQQKICTFNDDIQGTAAVALGTILSAIHITQKKLSEHKIVIVGAGSAGCGIAKMLISAMVEEGLSEEDAYQHLFMVDRDGLLIEEMKNLLPFQEPFKKSKMDLINWKLNHSTQIELADVVRNAKPTVLIGVCGQPGIFNESIIREMAGYCDHPIIFPLSNPTARAEAEPQHLLYWTKDRAIIGTGSPFAPVKKKQKQFRVDQVNNCYIFPGVGLGVITCKSRHVTDSMFMVAAKALAEKSPARCNPELNLLPSLENIREISAHIAFAVAKEAMRLGLANHLTDDELSTKISGNMWQPEYVPYKLK